MQSFPEVFRKLSLGDSLAFELENHSPQMKTYVVIIPRKLESNYEIRYLEHNEKYTDTDWGMDYDYVLDDKTTRVKRLFIENEAEILNFLTNWGKSFSDLKPIDDFDSSLIHSPIDSYLENPNERSHLWKSKN